MVARLRNRRTGMAKLNTNAESPSLADFPKNPSRAAPYPISMTPKTGKMMSRMTCKLLNSLNFR